MPGQRIPPWYDLTPCRMRLVVLDDLLGFVHSEWQAAVPQPIPGSHGVGHLAFAHGLHRVRGFDRHRRWPGHHWAILGVGNSVVTVGSGDGRLLGCDTSQP